MDALTISAASGIQARMESLELLANNIANQATAGYKTDREFYSVYSSVPGARTGPGRLPVLERQWTDFSQGALTPTGNPLDLALSGSGFFAVKGPQGAWYTRNGHFQLSPEGNLETQQGYAVLDTSGAPVQLDPSRAVEISADGTVIQNDVPVTSLDLVEFGQPEALRKQAGGYFEAVNPSMRPDDATDTRVYQGKLESANFTPSEAAVRMVGVMRQFEMLQKAVQLGSDMNRRAVEQVAKVGG